MNKPLVSVIIPIYNAEKFLSKCLNSVIKQSFKNFEIICINDGSTDSSAAILEQFAQKDSRIKAINQKNSGVSVARNLGLEMSLADYIYFVDSDDYIHPQLLELTTKEIIKHKADFVSFKYQQLDLSEIHKYSGEQKKITDYEVFPIDKPYISYFYGEHGLFDAACFILYLKSSLKDLKFYPGIYHEDLLFNTLYFAKNANKGIFLDEILYFYVKHENSITGRALDYKRTDDQLFLLNKLYNEFKDDKEKWTLVQKHTLPPLIRRVLLYIKNNVEKRDYFVSELQKLYKAKIITYAELSFWRKFKLWLVLRKNN